MTARPLVAEDRTTDQRKEPVRISPAACSHCGLPVPADSRHAGFCCSGCQAVHALLESSGLTRFYALGGGRGQPIGTAPRPTAHDWVDDLEAPDRDQVQVSLDVQGIHCAACIWLLQELWRRQPGGLHFQLNPGLGRAQLAYDPKRFSLRTYLESAERLGYHMAPASKSDGDPLRGLLIRLGVCVALALNTMMFALAGYLGLDSGPTARLFEVLAFGLATLAVVIGGPVFFVGALAGLRQQILHLDLPISLGILLAWSSCAYAFARGDGAPYFDTVTVFVALMLLGRYLQRRALQRNRDYLLANDGAEHLRARRLRDGRLEQIPIAQIVAGDRLLLAPGDLVPSRGELLEEHAMFSLEWINGESAPRAFKRGATIPAGAFNSGRQPVIIEAAVDPRASGLSELLATPTDDRDNLGSRDRFWVRLNRGYVAIVLPLAALAGVLWLFLDASRSLDIVTSVLVVTCPCALGLATPLAFDLAVARLRRQGVYVRTLSLLEKALGVRRVLFDKTGTLTWGGLRVEQIRPVPPELRDVLLTMTSGSNHPVSQAIDQELRGDGFTWLDDLRVEEFVGSGLQATWRGSMFRLGVPRFALGDKPGERDNVCLFVRDGHVEAAFRLEEDVRQGYREEITGLQEGGYSVGLLSGDRQDKAERVAAHVGIPRDHVFGELSPEQKAEHVRAGDAAHTMMIGDGLNDAPAFDAALCAGTPALDRPVMPSRADFFFTGNGAGAVTGVLRMARRFRSTVTTNLGLAGVYNLAAVGLCFAGMMSPLLCAVLMPASSLALIGHTAWRLRRTDQETAWK